MNPADFIMESNAIEGIYEGVTEADIVALADFLAPDPLRVRDLEAFVNHFQPDAVLRDRYGLDVYVGDHVPPKGSPHITESLNALLTRINNGELSPFDAHVQYETLHPFTDGNGRSGRALWLRMMGERGLDLSFLQMFYYQSLQANRP